MSLARFKPARRLATSILWMALLYSCDTVHLTSLWSMFSFLILKIDTCLRNATPKEGASFQMDVHRMVSLATVFLATRMKLLLY